MSSEIVLCFRYVVPTFGEDAKGILITALMSSAPEERNLPHELDIDGTVMILKSVGKVTGLTEDRKVKFMLYPVGVENPTEGEEVIAPVSEKSMDAILEQLEVGNALNMVFHRD